MYSNNIKEIDCKFILLIDTIICFFIVTSTNFYKNIVEIVVINVVLLIWVNVYINKLIII